LSEGEVLQGSNTLLANRHTFTTWMPSAFTWLIRFIIFDLLWGLSISSLFSIGYFWIPISEFATAGAALISRRQFPSHFPP
jgi:hypothetical protein